MQLEDLLNKKQIYEGMKEILEKAINSFSSITFNDDLLGAKDALASYFSIEEDNLYANKVSGVSDNINTNLNKLKEVKVIVDTKLEELNNNIMSIELSGGM